MQYQKIGWFGIWLQSRHLYYEQWTTVEQVLKFCPDWLMIEQKENWAPVGQGFKAQWFEKKSLTNRSRKIDLPFLLEDTFYTGIFCQKIRLTDVSEYGHCYCFHFDHRDRHCFHSGLGLWPRWWAGGPRARFDRNRSWLEVKMRLKSCCDGRRGRRTFVAPLSRVHQGLKNFRNAKMWSRKIQWFCSGHLIIFWSTCHFLTASWQRLAVSVWDFSLHAIDKIF